jgi:hypothetical protein
MRLKNTFVKGRMNKDLDERLLPKGEYPNAENIRLANSEGSDVGAIENVLGNKSLTSMGLTNAVSIGSFSDDSNQKVYWFVTADEKDVLMEYDFTQPVGLELSTVLESSTVLNFSKDHLITGVVKVINGEHDKDLLVWTDDLNQPRCVNIARFKANTLDPLFTLEEEDILLIKKPPMAAPTVTLVKDDLVGFDDDIFLSIAYRYVYEDRERSALSSFSNYSYNPGIFNLDYQAMENSGMANRYNNLEVELNTGSKRVKEIEVISKQPNSNKLSLIRSFDKSVLGWVDNTTQTFTFKSDSVYMSLPQDELFRAYDNVPLKAKALEMIGTRLVFGNYVEGYDMVDSGGNPVNLDEIEISINTSEVEETSLITGTSALFAADDTFELEITQSALDISRNIRFDLNLKFDLPYPNNGVTMSTGSVEIIYNVPENVPVDNNGVIDLSAEETFRERFLDRMSQLIKVQIMNNTDSWPGDYVLVLEDIYGSNPSGIITSNGNLTLPKYTYQIYEDDTLAVPHGNAGTIYNKLDTTIPSEIYVIRDSRESLKSNRNYELGLVYLDEFNRASTVQTWLNNTINVPHNRAPEANNLRLTIPSTINAPTWADRFKVVVRQNRGDYHTVYSSFSFKDETDAWILLDGDNKNKVSEGDEIVPKILQGEFMDSYRRVKVLEVVAKEQNFIENNFLSNEANSELKEPAGTYMRVKASALPELSKETKVFFNEEDWASTAKSSLPAVYIDLFSNIEDNATDATHLTLVEGTKIIIKLSSSYNFRSGNPSGWKNYIFEEEYTVIGEYESFEAWFVDNVSSMYFRDSFDEATHDYRGESSTNYTSDWPATQPKVSVVTGNDIYTTIPGAGSYANSFFYSNHPLYGIQNDDKQYLRVEGFESGNGGSRNGYVGGSVEIILSGGDMVFETLPVEVDTEIFYETEQTFDIANGLHPTSIDLKYHNCYTFRNGVESYRYKDGFNTNSLNIDLRPTSTSIEKYKEIC